MGFIRTSYMLRRQWLWLKKDDKVLRMMYAGSRAALMWYVQVNSSSSFIKEPFQSAMLSSHSRQSSAKYIPSYADPL